MIPKKIHYCWFGGNPLPDLAQKCIESWKKYFPNYEIIEWNESNFDVNYNNYTQEAFNNKKYAFLTDVARLYIIYNEGGIYFDVDVEVISDFSDIIKNGAFFGLESKNTVATGLGFGAEKGNWIVKKLLDDYNDKQFLKQNGELDLTPCPIINSKIFLKNGFNLNGEKETINNVTIYPVEYFNPKNCFGGEITINDNTHSIHHYDGSWLSLKERERAYKKDILIKKYGTKKGNIIYKTLYLPYRLISNIKELGIKGSIDKVIKKRR